MGSEYITVADAREMLGVSKTRIAQMLREGELAWQPNPLDRRGKVVRLSDVQAILQRAPRKNAA